MYEVSGSILQRKRKQEHSVMRLIMPCVSVGVMITGKGRGNMGTS